MNSKLREGKSHSSPLVYTANKRILEDRLDFRKIQLGPPAPQNKLKYEEEKETSLNKCKVDKCPFLNSF